MQMVDTPSVLSSSYINITAAEASETEAIPYAEIQAAVIHRHKMTFLKLMWTISANTILYSRRIDALESERQQLKKYTESLLLAISELEKFPPKGSTEEEQQVRIQACQGLNQSLRKVKNNLEEVSRDLTYFNDYNEDSQRKFRDQMSKYRQREQALVDEKIDLILAYLKQRNIKIDKPEAELRNALKTALNDPELQEAYLKAAGQTENKSFTAKLKGWFTS